MIGVALMGGAEHLSTGVRTLFYFDGIKAHSRSIQVVAQMSVVIAQRSNISI